MEEKDEELPLQEEESEVQEQEENDGDGIGQDTQSSPDEEDLTLDDADQSFLLEAVDSVTQEVIIEHPDPSSSTEPSCSTNLACTALPVKPLMFYGLPKRKCTLQTSAVNSEEGEQLPLPKKSRSSSKTQSVITGFDFRWKRGATKVITNTTVYDYGQVNLKLDDSADIDAVEVFEQASDFSTLVSLVVEQSELYMKQKGIPFQTNADELRAFFGICLVMGYHVLQSIRDYWSTQPDLQVQFIANTMSCARFEAIRSSLHFANNEDMLPRTHPQCDRAFKVRPLIEHFNRCFQAARNPSKQQSIDEHMIKYKGQNIIKQYIRNKPVKWGFKLWCRCDAISGYLYQFDIYTGRKTDTEHGLGESVIEKIYLCGTVRVDRKNMPKNLKADKEMKRGDVDTMSANGITCVKWMDNRSVTLLSNFLTCKKDDMTHVLRRQAGCAEKLHIPCPTIVTIYNKYMGGVDLMDQKKVSYETDRRSKIKFYLRIFFDLLDIAVNNSHCIYIQANEERHPECKAITPLEYRQMIARSLVGGYSNRQRKAPSAPVRSSRSVLPAPKPKHSMIRSDRRKRCAQRAKHVNENRTDSLCDTCKVHLCYTKTRNCFADYHSLNC
ncbi:piggyBac transposable element-derived protein 4-like [Bufo bufo]|uniref:piggyBac transposable element-derived protein 4-like n=1 Tax=Bufo bufo TaxID=8384 RepID=UPI001ABDEA50|nr:piggyBac transposable element-derived protein 4-like [Bufo bufo]